MINSDQVHTCGDCAFARRIKTDPLQIECGGVPPTPVFFGMQPVQRPVFNSGVIKVAEATAPVLRCVPPVLPKTYLACALFMPAVRPADVADSLPPG
jgi:hypothetical protein